MDPETLRIAKQIKALKEGKQQGEIKIQLKGDSMVSKLETKEEKKKKKYSEEESQEKHEKHAKLESQSEEDEEKNAEEEKVQPGRTKSMMEKSSVLKVFKDFVSISDLRDFIIK